jgi:hypothetical protein
MNVSILSVNLKRIESKISGLAKVGSASFFHSPLIANPLVSPTESNCQSANFFLVRC